VDTEPVNIVTPEYVYGVFNDLDPSPYNREYVPSLFVDSFTRNRADLYINGRMNRLLVWAKRPREDDRKPRTVIRKTFTVEGEGMESVERAFDYVVPRASLAAGKTINLLAIGDSITAADLRDRQGNNVGTSSWWTFPVEAFTKDNLDRGKDDIRMQATGTINVRRGRTFTYKGAEYPMDGCAEGRGSRTTAFYLRHAVHWSKGDLPAAWLMLGLKTVTGREFADTVEDRMRIRNTPQGKYPHDYGKALWERYRSHGLIKLPDAAWSDSEEQRKLVDGLVAYCLENPENPFFDIETVRSGKDYAFNLEVYLKRYRTLTDNGKTRLVAGETAGTKVTDPEAFDVCKPTHVAIFLGENDRWHFPGADPEKVTDDIIQIGDLCRAYDSSIYVAYVCHPSLGVWYPNRYEDVVVREKSEGFNQYKFSCMELLRAKLGDRATQERSRKYFSPAFFTIDPTSAPCAKVPKASMPDKAPISPTTTTPILDSMATGAWASRSTPGFSIRLRNDRP